jgi:[ribosomal protein S5]-alanine N-acetyltransferase
MTNIPVLETPRLKLIPLNIESVSQDNREEVVKQLGLQLANMILGEQIDQQIQAAMRESLENIIRDKKNGRWYDDWESILVILKKTNAIIGGICYQKNPEDCNEVQIGYMIRPEHQNNGYITEALRAAIPWLFQNLDVACLVAETIKSNLPSRRVLEKMGMTIYKETANSLCWELEY